MKKLLPGALVCLFMFNTALAAAPQRLHVEESIQLNAPADKVWAVVGNFSALDKWHPAIKSSFMNTPVSRVLDLGDGKRLLEELESRDDAGMTLSYRIASMTTTETIEANGLKVDKKVLPINTYSSTIRVMAEGSDSKVTWSGDFYRAWLADSPPPAGMTDEDATKTIQAVYRAGLDNLPAVLGVASNQQAAAPPPVPEAPAAPAAPAAPQAPAAPEPVAQQTAAPAAQPAAQPQAGNGAAAYDGHLQCEGGKCKVDRFVMQGFRAFSQCQVCHGIDGNGSTFAPSLMMKLKEINYDTFVNRVTNGFQGQIGVMPPWKDNPNIMKNIDNLYAYLKARSDEKIPAGKLEKY